MLSKTEELEKEMKIKMVAPFSVGDDVVIAVNTHSGPDFIAYKLMVPMENGKWWVVVTDEDSHRVSETNKTLEIEEMDIQDFTDTAEQKASVTTSSKDWDFN